MKYPIERYLYKNDTMANKIIVNEKNSLSWRDVAKSWVMIVVFPIVQGVIEFIVANGSFSGIDYQRILIATLSATFLFLVQRFNAPASVTTLYNSNQKAIQVAKTIDPTKK